MGDMDVMIAVRSGVIKREGHSRLMIRKGVSTAHAGAEVVRDYPHLWGPLGVEFPAGDVVTAAVADARLSHTQALRDLYAALVERGHDIPEGTPADEVAAAVVDLAVRALDAAGGVTALGEGEPGEIVTSGAGREYLVGVDAGGWKTYTPVDGGEPAPDEPDGPADEGEGEPADVVDPGTPEGRKAIRAWAKDRGLDVRDTGPLSQDIIDRWAHDQGGRS